MKLILKKVNNSVKYLFLLAGFGLFGQLKKDIPLRFLALGDSYTIGERVGYEERWPSQLYEMLGSTGYVLDRLDYIATTGWTTKNLQNAILTSNLTNDYNLVSLLIGVNNQYQNKSFSLYETEFPLLVESALRFVNNDTSQLFVVSIPDYAYTPFGRADSRISDQLDVYNDFAAAFCDSLGITFFYITDISRQGILRPSLVAGDGLHPSGLQYGLWADLIFDHFSKTVTKADVSVLSSFWAIYPNPVVDELYLDIVGYNYTVFDALGTLVKEGAFSNCINLHQLKTGSYYLKVDQQFFRFFKQ